MPRRASSRRPTGRGARPGRVAVAAAIALCCLPFAAGGQTITIDSGACRALTAHQPAPDVAYRPGVDATGRAVAPADLSGGPSPVAQSFVFDLNADLRPFLPPGSRLFQPQIGVGRITVGADGGLLFNGQRLAGEDRAAVAALCRRPAR